MNYKSQWKPLIYTYSVSPLLNYYFLGLCQDLKSRRNPRLVPYALLDERTKKSNRDSLREAIRTMVGYGYDIDPPDQEGETLLLTPTSHKPMNSSPSTSFKITCSLVTQLLFHTIFP